MSENNNLLKQKLTSIREEKTLEMNDTSIAK